MASFVGALMWTYGWPLAARKHCGVRVPAGTRAVVLAAAYARLVDKNTNSPHRTLKNALIKTLIFLLGYHLLVWSTMPRGVGQTQGAPQALDGHVACCGISARK